MVAALEQRHQRRDRRHARGEGVPRHSALERRQVLLERGARRVLRPRVLEALVPRRARPGRRSRSGRSARSPRRWSDRAPGRRGSRGSRILGTSNRLSRGGSLLERGRETPESRECSKAHRFAFAPDAPNTIAEPRPERGSRPWAVRGVRCADDGGSPFANSLRSSWGSSQAANPTCRTRPAPRCPTGAAAVSARIGP